MTENQLNKLKNRLLNIQTQLNGASIVLEKGEPLINSKITQANKLVADAFEMCKHVKTYEPTPQQQQKKRRHKEQAYSYLTPHNVIISRSEPPTYNRMCRNYSEVHDRNGKVLERTCIVGMDMCYCSKKCAYATNNVCSLRG
jgi:hypothetical protein